MLKAFKFRIYPNQAQSAAFDNHFGCARHVYNWALDLKKKTYEETKKNLSKRELQNLLVTSKKAEKPWLKEVNSQSLLASLMHLDTAFSNFFKGLSKFPQYKKKYDSCQSYQCPQHVSVDFAEGTLHLPKIKGVKTTFHRTFSGKIKTVTIRRFSTRKYYVSILVETQTELPLRSTIEPEKTIGLDMGITHFLVDSEGNKIENPRILDKALHRLKIAQRKLSRQCKTSHQRAKQKNIVARIHERVTHKRYDFVHQTSAKLAVKNQATSIAVEDLHIKGMIRNRKLARAISNCGWRLFLSALAYKCEWNGKNLIKIGRFIASSKTCHSCLRKQAKMPLSIREWQCSCGLHHDRDINAAKMIRQVALAQSPGQLVAA